MAAGMWVAATLLQFYAAQVFLHLLRYNGEQHYCWQVLRRAGTSIDLAQDCRFPVSVFYTSTCPIQTSKSESVPHSPAGRRLPVPVGDCECHDTMITRRIPDILYDMYYRQQLYILR